MPRYEDPGSTAAYSMLSSRNMSRMRSEPHCGLPAPSGTPTGASSLLGGRAVAIESSPPCLLGGAGRSASAMILALPKSSQSIYPIGGAGDDERLLPLVGCGRRGASLALSLLAGWLEFA